MRRNRILKLLVLIVWMLAMAGVTTLLVAANKKQKTHLCEQLVIGMRGGKGMYIDKNDILKLIEKSNGNILNKQVSAIDIARMERNLELNPWISSAEIYFDSKDILHVFVEERQPIARVFSSTGTSFYIDSSGHAMPLIEKTSARLQVITGFPGRTRWNARDSALMDEVKEIATFIHNNDFWNAQVGQVHITSERKFEIIPVVGDHVIKVGNAEGIEEKMRNLFVFYKQVLSKVGFNKYETLDVQYKGQVVAVKKTPSSPVDSIQLQKNIEELMTRAIALVGDEGMLPDENSIKNDSTVSSKTARNNQVSTKTDPNPILAQAKSNPQKTELSNPAGNQQERTPKAVMKVNRYR